ncbi:unnamed protein product [Amoebophrya sp. A25]|nr:unnamed protein product [Amoebophrya sp. A25]|eukprot:GSA25T00016259001.1
MGEQVVVPLIESVLASALMSKYATASAALVAVVAIALGALWLLLSEGDDDVVGSFVQHLDPKYFVAPHIRDSKSRENADAVDLSVVIPAFNEKERISIMLDEALGFLKKQKGSYEVILVDDGSGDTTAKLVLDKYADEKVNVVRLKKNMGKGFAVKVGMLSAVGKRRLMVDADGATKFSDLAGLQEKIDSNKYQIAFGSRHHLSSDASVKRAWYRNVFMWGLHLLVRILITSNGQPIQDTQCGFKLFTEDAAEKLFGSLHIRRWAFDLELVVLAQRYSLSIAEVPVNWHEVAGSKLSLIPATLSMLKDMVRIRLSYLTGVWTTASIKG